VLMNLAANARDAMPGGGLLTIETGSREIDEHFINNHGFGVPGKYAAICVSDTGAGMDAETSKKIFEPFFTTKEVGKGTGLGLAIVYGVVTQHNGFIDVLSEPGKGATFALYFPRLCVEEMDEGMDGKEEGTQYRLKGNETVLVVEDDPSIRMLAETYLGKLGYRVILAHDGQDAVEKFKAYGDEIAVTLMDMVMPKKSGKEAFEEIRYFKPGAKVIFMSGYSPDLLKNRGILESGEEVIIKPVQPLELARKVRCLLDGNPDGETFGNVPG